MTEAMREYPPRTQNTFFIAVQEKVSLLDERTRRKRYRDSLTRQNNNNKKLNFVPRLDD